MIDIEKKEWGPALLELSGEWEELLGRCSRPTIYSTFDYVYTSCTHFKGEEAVFFLLLRSRGEGRLLAIFPVSIRKANDHGVSIRRVEHGITASASEVDKPYPIIDRDYEAACWKRFSEYFRREFRQWDVIAYNELWLESALNQRLRELFPRPIYWTKVRAGAESPIFALDCGWDTYWSAHRHIRSKIRRIEKQLGDHLSFAVTCDPVDVDRCLDAYISTEQAGAKVDTGLMRPEKQRFYRELFPKLAAKQQLYFAMLCDRDTVIAVHVSFVFQNTVYFALCTFNPEYGNLSPGLVLHFRFIEYFCGKGYSQGDFLAGYAHYLNPWATCSEKTTNIQVRRISGNNGYIAMRRLVRKMGFSFTRLSRAQTQ